MNDGLNTSPRYLGGTYYPHFMAGNKGVEPLQTRSQSPARYHYANPLYFARRRNRCLIISQVRKPIPPKSHTASTGFEPAIFYKEGLLYASYC